MEPLIVFRDVARIYGSGEAEVRALDGVDLTINKGEFVAIMGPSGSGKSTSMNIIGCLDRPTSGKYLFQGVEVQDLDQDSRALLRRHYLGFVFQGFNLLARASALENVELPLIYKGIPKAERVARAKRALEKVGLAGREGHDPSQLSGGQAQRVGIARALAASPDVLLCDEPTSALDPSTTDDLLELLVKLRDELQVTILIITHDLGVVRRIADRVAVLEGGRIVDSGSVEEVAAHQHSPLLSDIGVEDARGAAELRVSGGHEVAAIPFISRITRELGIDVRLASGGAHAIGEVHVLSATLGFEGEEDRDRAADWLRANGFTVEVGGVA